MSNKRIITYYGRPMTSNGTTFGSTLHDYTLGINESLPNIIQDTYNIIGTYNSKNGESATITAANLVTATINNRVRNTTTMQRTRFVQNLSAKGYVSGGAYSTNAWSGTTLQGVANAAVITHELELLLNSGAGSNKIYKMDSDIIVVFKIDSGIAGSKAAITTFVGAYQYHSITYPTSGAIVYQHLDVLGKSQAGIYDLYFPDVNLSLDVTNQNFVYTFTASANVNYSVDIIVDSLIVGYDINGSDAV